MRKIADNIEISGLEFEITGNTDDAVKGLSSLTRSLSKLKRVSETGLGVKKLTAELSEFADSFKKLDFGDTSGLSGLSEAFKSIGTSGVAKTVAGMSKLGTVDFSNIKALASHLSEVQAVMPTLGQVDTLKELGRIKVASTPTASLNGGMPSISKLTGADFGIAGTDETSLQYLALQFDTTVAEYPFSVRVDYYNGTTLIDSITEAVYATSK